MTDSLPADGPWSYDLAFFGMDIERIIRFARVRCVPRHEIIERVLMIDSLNPEELDAYAYRLTELKLTPAEFRFLAESMTEIARKTESASPEVKNLVDKALLRLVRILPLTLANRFARPYLDHKRKGRRKWAYAILRKQNLRGQKVSRRTAGTLARIIQETGDTSILGILTRTPECVRLVGAGFLIDKLNGKDEEHWRGRVLECLRTYDRDAAIALASKFPWEFTYAAGRSGDPTLLPVIRSLFESNSKSGKFVSIYAWCLGKIGADKEIDVLERFILHQHPTRPSLDKNM